MRLSLYTTAYLLSSVDVALSRRNLLALLSKLDHPDSACTLTKYEDGVTLRVTAESDEDHYRDRPEGGPGPMVEWTERDIERMCVEGVPGCRSSH